MKLNRGLSAIVLAALLSSCGQRDHRLLLPVIGEKRVVAGDTVYHKVKDFSFTNQAGETVTGKTVKGKIYVADFFFATCQSICPVMSSNLKEVQAAFAKDDSVLILSHSVNPLHDTVQVLEGYARTYGAIPGKWHLLTGNKKAIYDMAKESYLLNAVEDDGSPEGFLHSEFFMLVDTEGRLRGTYDGTDKPQVQKLIEDIRLLKQED